MQGGWAGISLSLWEWGWRRTGRGMGEEDALGVASAVVEECAEGLRLLAG